jgi:hypothetical protein
MSCQGVYSKCVRAAIRTRVEAIFSYRVEILIAIRFAANRMVIRTGYRICVDSPLRQQGVTIKLLHILYPVRGVTQVAKGLLK